MPRDLDICDLLGIRVADLPKVWEKVGDSADPYYITFAPEYVDDDWRDPVDGDALSNLRPALLPTDGTITLDNNGQVEHTNPTECAKRWGRHPEGPGTRSRTSPTRSTTRIFGSGGPQRPVAGKWLAQYFERKALNEDMPLRDWLDQSLPKKFLNEDDRVYLDWLDELFQDEVWQGMLFNDLTMDEVSSLIFPSRVH